MNLPRITPGLQLFGNAVQWDCNIQDLKLVLRKTEEIEFPEEENVLDDEVLIDDIFPDIMRKSFVITLLIALDAEFKSFCAVIGEATGQRLKWNDLKGSTLERFVAFSEKVCGLQSICDMDSRQSLKGIIEIRNCIVHNNSCLENFSKRKAIEQFCDGMEGVRIEEGMILLELDACYRIADIVHEFMYRAYLAASVKFPRDM